MYKALFSILLINFHGIGKFFTLLLTTAVTVKKELYIIETDKCLNVISFQLLSEQKVNAFIEKRHRRIARKVLKKWHLWSQFQIEKKEFFSVRSNLLFLKYYTAINFYYLLH